MTAAPSDLAVVIVTHNSADVVGRVLDALGGPLRSKAIVVDNASTDATPDLIAAAGVRCLRNATNLGYGAACNQAARAVDAGALCFLNPDCEPTPELFRLGHAAVRDAPNTCAVPVLVEHGVDVPGRQPGYSAAKIASDVLSAGYGTALVGWLAWWPRFHDRSWFWPHGACWFVNREAFLAVGGFDSAFFLYMEDVDFGHRWHASGRDVQQLPCRLRHDRSHGARMSLPRRRALMTRARLDYARAHYGPGFATFLHAAVGPALWLRGRMDTV